MSPYGIVRSLRHALVAATLIAASVLLGSNAHAQTSPPGGTEPTSAGVTAEKLRQNIGLFAKNEGFSTLLAGLSERSQAELTTAPRLGDYRLVAFLANRPLSTAMDDLVWLFSHGNKPAGYEWEPVDPRRGAFQFQRTPYAPNESRAAREFARVSARWLREYRQSRLLSGSARRKAASEAVSPFLKGPETPTPPVAAVDLLYSLSAGDFQKLLTSGSVSFPLGTAPGRVRELVQRIPRQSAPAPPSANGAQTNGETIELSFLPSPDTPGTYVLSADTRPAPLRQTVGVLMDPLGIVRVLPESSARQLEETGPSHSLDLKAVLAGKRFPRDLPSQLETVAKAAGVNILCEFYPPEEPFEELPGAPQPPFRVSDKEKLHPLLNRIALTHGYNVGLHEGVYHLWKKTWFLERPNLVPEEIVQRLRAVAGSGEPYRLEELSDVAARLTDGQMQMLERTLRPTPVYVAHAANALRFYARLDNAQRWQASGEAGLSLDNLRPDQREALTAFVPAASEPARDGTTDQGASPSVFFFVRQAGQGEHSGVELVIKRNGQQVGSGYVRLNSGQTQRATLTPH